MADVEIQSREFLELNDLMGPLEVEQEHPVEDGSGLSHSLGLPNAVLLNLLMEDQIFRTWMNFWLP